MKMPQKPVVTIFCPAAATPCTFVPDCHTCPFQHHFWVLTAQTLPQFLLRWVSRHRGSIHSRYQAEARKVTQHPALHPHAPHQRWEMPGVQQQLFQPHSLFHKTMQMHSTDTPKLRALWPKMDLVTDPKKPPCLIPNIKPIGGTLMRIEMKGI